MKKIFTIILFLFPHFLAAQDIEDIKFEIDTTTSGILHPLDGNLGSSVLLGNVFKVSFVHITNLPCQFIEPSFVGVEVLVGPLKRTVVTHKAVPPDDSTQTTKQYFSYILKPKPLNSMVIISPAGFKTPDGTSFTSRRLINIRHESQAFSKGIDLFFAGDYKGALEYMQPEAKAGSAEAMVYVAECYLILGGDNPDMNIITNMYRRAMSQNCPMAFSRMARLYECGKYNFEYNLQKAFELYKKGADLADNGSQYALIRYYRDGLVCPKDPKKAWEYCVSCENVDALFELGNMYYDGYYVDVDYGSAISNFEKACVYQTPADSIKYRMAILYNMKELKQYNPITAGKLVNDLLANNYEPVNSIADTILLSAQEAQDEIDFEKNAKVIFYCPPSYPGGSGALQAFIAQNSSYPPDTKKGVQGRVLVSVRVSMAGYPIVRISSGIEKALDREALRVINLIPKWNPGYKILEYKGKQKKEYEDRELIIPIIFRYN